MKAAPNDFPQGTAMERGRITSGHDKRRTGNSIKAGHAISARKGPEGNEAGLAPWLDKCPSRNLIKAAHSFFWRLCQRSHRTWARRSKYEMTAESTAFATITAGVSCMTNSGTVSNLNVGGAL